jgi:hypothetical protein
MPDLSPNQREFIDSSWKNRWESILQAQNQVLNWIFAVHGGGIAGLLAFAASKGSSCSVKFGLLAFSVGLVLIIVYGVLMFYFEVRHFQKFRSDIDNLFAGSIEWSKFSEREASRPNRYRICEILAWVSGICGLVGIIAAVTAIL